MARIPEIVRRNPISQVSAAPAGQLAGDGWRALADVTRQAAEFVRPAAVEQATLEGQNAVYRDENGALQVDEKGILSGEMGQIHDAAAFAKFLAMKETDIAESMNELVLKYQFDPDGFQKAAEGYVGILKDDTDIPAMLKSQVIGEVEREAGRRFNGLRSQQIQRTHADTARETAAARDALARDYVSLLQAGDVEAAEALYGRIESMTDYRVSSPFITDTPAVGDTYLRGLRAEGKAAQLVKRLSDLDGAESLAEEERAELEALVNDPDLDPGTRQRLYEATQGRFKQIDAAGFVGAITDGAYEAKVRRVESGNNPNAKAKTSSATGLHQFVAGTWLGLVDRYKPGWAKGKTREQLLDYRRDSAKSSEMFQHFRRENAAVLSEAGIPINDATEYLAHFLGAGGAVEALSKDPATPLKDFMPAETIAANSFLKDFTVSDLQNWAARKMTVKASDLAALQVQVDGIEDSEVRGMASQLLADRIGIRRTQELAARQEYEERLALGEKIPASEVMTDHNLGTDDQLSLARAIERNNAESTRLAETVAMLNDPATVWDPTDNGHKSRVNDAYKHSRGDAQPLSTPEDTAVALELGAQAVFPRDAFNALTAQLQSDDAATLAQAAELGLHLLERNERAFGNYRGQKAVRDALTDYRGFAEFGAPEEAAQKVIDMRAAPPKNVRDAAKIAAEELEVSDIHEHFDQSWLNDPTIGIAGQVSVSELIPTHLEEAMMGEYRMLFEAAFVATGDKEVAKGRALNEMGRIHGVNTVSGLQMVMKYPPQKFYPAVSGSHEWMSEQLEKEVNDFVFEGDAPDGEADWYVDVQIEGADEVDTRERIPLDRIHLVSDDVTSAQVKAGQPASYVVYYFDGDKFEQLPTRYVFDAGPARAAARERFDRRREFVEDQETNPPPTNGGIRIQPRPGSGGYIPGG